MQLLLSAPISASAHCEIVRWKMRKRIKGWLVILVAWGSCALPAAAQTSSCGSIPGCEVIVSNEIFRPALNPTGLDAKNGVLWISDTVPLGSQSQGRERRLDLGTGAYSNAVNSLNYPWAASALGSALYLAVGATTKDPILKFEG